MRDRKQEIVSRLFECCGRTYADELNIHVEQNTPSEWFKLLIFALLASTRISKNLSIRAAREVFREGWITPQRMAAATWQQRVDVLDRAGYARYDESTSRYLDATANLLLDRYKGDLRHLREVAERQPDRERALLKELKGIGDVGCDIFFRDAQAVWDELHPFADRRALNAAKQLGLGLTANELANLVDGKEFVRLIGALARCDLEHRYEEVREIVKS